MKNNFINELSPVHNMIGVQLGREHIVLIASCDALRTCWQEYFSQMDMSGQLQRAINSFFI
jgi:hypothetical protein